MLLKVISVGEPVLRNLSLPLSIEQLLSPDVDRGLITRQQIRNAPLGEPARKMIEKALRQAA